MKAVFSPIPSTMWKLSPSSECPNTSTFSCQVGTVARRCVGRGCHALFRKQASAEFVDDGDVFVGYIAENRILSANVRSFQHPGVDSRYI